MQAGSLVRRGTVVVEEALLPALSAPGQVLVRNLVSTVCGSDVHIVFGDDIPPDDRKPGYPGHESVGVVVESSDPSFTPGDLVLAVPPLRYAGGFAEYQLLPSRYAILLPPGSSPEHVILAQQLGTVIYGMKRFWPGAGHGTAVVLGAGPVGLCFTRLCRLAGFPSVITSDLHPDRLDVAAAMGATMTVQATGDSVVEAVHAATGGAGAALVVEAAGTDVTRLQAIACVGLDGVIGMFGLPEGPELTVPFETLFRQRPRVEFCWDAQSEPGHDSFHAAIDAIADGRVDATLLAPRLWPVTQLAETLEAARTARAGHVKFGVRFGGTDG